ncbi:MAG: M28 family peptidase [Verrucomicrobiota bacterium JB023]|nr:M28 family peptidase [Verrucomicrobiota bacterium JB023]
MHRALILLALALVACDKKSEPSSQLTSSYPKGSPMAHTEAILSFGPRPPGSSALNKVRQYVSGELKKSGWVVGTQTFTARTPYGERSFTNLIARFPSGQPDKVWTQKIDGLLCAHIDSKLYPNKRFLGADDAASACGLIVTLAEELAKKPEQAARMEIIFFDGEEALQENITPYDGLYGSKAYAARWRATSRKPEFGILLDMVGHKNLSIKVPSDSPKELLTLMQKQAKQLGHDDHFGVARGPIIDDHVPLNQAGIPTIDLIGDFSASNWWHTERDNIGILSAESLEITRQVVSGMLADLLE